MMQQPNEQMDTSQDQQGSSGDTTQMHIARQQQQNPTRNGVKKVSKRGSNRPASG